MSKERERIDRLRRRHDHLVERIAERKAMPSYTRSQSRDIAEASALAWAIPILESHNETGGDLIRELINVLEEIEFGYTPHSGGQMCNDCWGIETHEPACKVEAVLVKSRAWLADLKLK